MIKFILFGAGKDGCQALNEIGSDRVLFFCDNIKRGNLSGLPVYSLDEAKGLMEPDSLFLVTSRKYMNEMVGQLKEKGIENYLPYVPGTLHRNITERLDESGWSEHYNEERVSEEIDKINTKRYSSWTMEMLKLTKEGDRVLEIGCGSGMTSAVLAMNGRKVVAMDYSNDSLILVNAISKKLEIEENIVTVRADATISLPFKDDEFDWAFQAGLLEHFHRDERIDMLKKWRRVSKTMVSMIPNSHSVCYRLGKKHMEENGSWSYGLEMPQASISDEFMLAGYENVKEYTIGIDEALIFLSKDNFVRNAFEQLKKIDGIDLNEWGQGYLLVTIGNKRSAEDGY